MMDVFLRRMKVHEANLERYARLLATQLTDTERTYIHRRIAEENSALKKLEAAHRARSLRSAADPGMRAAVRAITAKL